MINQERQAKNMYSHTNSKIHKKFIIPVGNLTPEEAQQEVVKFIADYKEEINFDDQLEVDSTNYLEYSPLYSYSKHVYYPLTEIKPSKFRNILQTFYQKIKSVFKAI